MASHPIGPTSTPIVHHFKPVNLSIFLKSNSAFLTKHHEEHHKILRNPYKFYCSSFLSLSRDGQLQRALKLVTRIETNNSEIGPEYYAELLQGCTSQRALSLGQQIHGLIIKKGVLYPGNEYITTKLVIFYAKCDALESANSLFCRVGIRNVFSWAAMIGMNSRLDLNVEALLGYCDMLENGILPDNFVVPNALKACGAVQLVGFGRGVHGYVLKTGLGGCVFIASSLVDMYGKCGVLGDSQKVFDNMSEKNVVAWNSMIVSYFQNGRNEEAIRIFYDMRVVGVEPTWVTMSSFLSASANLGALEEGKQGHCIAVLTGIELDNILGSSMINFYSKVGLIQEAELVFARMVEKDVVTWNLLISCYVQHGLVKNALKLCQLMRMENIRFDCVTMASLISASADTGYIELGRKAHGYCIRNYLGVDVVVTTSIVNMYASCGKIEYARRVFDYAFERDLVLWNAIMAAYAELGLNGEALRLFNKMQLDGLHPNVISWNSLILGFLRNGQIKEAKDMFSRMQTFGIEPNIVTWTTLITGLAQNLCSSEAILLFHRMLDAGIQPNNMSIIGVLSACTDTTSLQVGEAIHGYLNRQNVFMSTEIITSLVDMYAKCGRIDKAKKVFDMTSNKELALYNAMISGYACHGRGNEALDLYKHIQKEGLEPNEVTFTSILLACTHAGLVNEGLEVFVDILANHKSKPSNEHYGCLITLLSRCGNLDGAIRLILTMPFDPDAQMLGSLLFACREHQQIELGEHILKHLFKLEPDNSGNYVALSNAYAAAGRWNDSIELRSLMKKRGLEKSPGCSWVQIGRESHVFVAGDISHPQTEEIFGVITLLEKEMRLLQYNHIDINSEIYCS
ncbi:hypothetical protein Nepgr_006450 [Nepenthes gracilis]|uniref:Chlororespiratory reduction 21 n=1 Tax=Nepenthes gracilis TaxID=150966 RepID=A0AAD3S5I1_NEPGR|nr:hypothetical protein Nepgr_006450 [Nepenthes gracilis]